MTSQDPLAFRLFTEIGIISQLLGTQFENALPDGLRLSQFALLNHLARLGGEWSPVRLAAAFQVTKAAMTNTVQRLESRGLVAVKADPSDGRGKLVSLTAAGAAMRERCIESVQPWLVAVEDAMERDQMRAALSALTELRKYLDAHRA